MSEPRLIFEPASRAHTTGLSALFQRAGSACHCRYWHFAGDKNAWLGRLAHAPDVNARELALELEDPESAPRGIVGRDVSVNVNVAADSDEPHIVGWMKLTPVARMERLYASRPYRNLPCFSRPREGVLTVGCFLVDPAARRRGVARGLLEAGIRHARQLGARAIEAFPRRGEHLGDEELWMGPISIFEHAGFAVVNAFTPYAVLRLTL